MLDYSVHVNYGPQQNYDTATVLFQMLHIASHCKTMTNDLQGGPIRAHKQETELYAAIQRRLQPQLDLSWCVHVREQQRHSQVPLFQSA